MEFLNLRKTWVSLVNASLEMYADVITGKQTNQFWNFIKKLWMNMWIHRVIAH